MGPAVSFRNVSFAIGPKRVLDGLTFEVAAGETLVLLGRSGSGKTTALRLVNGMLFPASGEVVVEGVPTTTWDPVRLKRRIGYVIQDVGLFPHFDVAQNVGLVPRLESWPTERIAERVRATLDLVGLDVATFGRRRPRELSGGQRQRVGVARALAADPQILLLDEPFSSLDPITRLELQRQFLDLSTRLHKTALFVTHDVREALALATRIGLLHEGRLEFLGSARDFLTATTPEALTFRACLEERREAS
jgi:osmoprotectant transport system ATP-binding protein